MRLRLKQRLYLRYMTCTFSPAVDVTANRLEELRRRLPAAQNYGSAPKAMPKPTARLKTWFRQHMEQLPFPVTGAPVSGIALGYVSGTLIYARSLPRDKRTHGELLRAVRDGQLKVIRVTHEMQPQEYLIRA